jgi:hypothetical protein
MSSGRENTPLPIAQSMAYAISSDLMGAAGSVALLQVPCGAHGDGTIGPVPVLRAAICETIVPRAHRRVQRAILGQK